MRHYARENERGLGRIAELEHRKITCEAGYAAIVACWTQVKIDCILFSSWSYTLLFMLARRDNSSVP